MIYALTYSMNQYNTFKLKEERSDRVKQTLFYYSAHVCSYVLYGIAQFNSWISVEGSSSSEVGKYTLFTVDSWIIRLVLTKITIIVRT